MLPLIAAAAGARTNPGEQHVERERLRQVVVGPCLQAANDVFRRIAPRQQQDWGRDVLAPDPAGYLEPVDERHHHVQDDDVERLALGGAQGGRAVVAHVDRMPFVLEFAAHVLRDLHVVVDQQDFHSHVGRQGSRSFLKVS
jgi:hypothetical protein